MYLRKPAHSTQSRVSQFHSVVPHKMDCLFRPVADFMVSLNKMAYQIGQRAGRKAMQTMTRPLLLIPTSFIDSVPQIIQPHSDVILGDHWSHNNIFCLIILKANLKSYLCKSDVVLKGGKQQFEATHRPRSNSLHHKK